MRLHHNPRDPSPITSAINKHSLPDITLTALLYPLLVAFNFLDFMWLLSFDTCNKRDDGAHVSRKSRIWQRRPIIHPMHHVGAFAQSTSVFSATGSTTKIGGAKNQEDLTDALYSYSQIKLTGFVGKNDGCRAGKDRTSSKHLMNYAATLPCSLVSQSLTNEKQHHILVPT